MTVTRWLPGLATLKPMERGLPPLPEGDEVAFPSVAAAAQAVSGRVAAAQGVAYS